MYLDKTDDDIDAATAELVGLVEHPVSLSDACCRADVELELAAFALTHQLQKSCCLAFRSRCCATFRGGGRRRSQISECPRLDGHLERLALSAAERQRGNGHSAAQKMYE
jgi:hypothetical protein